MKCHSYPPLFITNANLYNELNIDSALNGLKFVFVLFILQPFRHFTYVTIHSPTLPSLYLRHSSFSNHSVASPTSQFIIQLFYRFSYVTSSSLNSPGEPPMLINRTRCMKNLDSLNQFLLITLQNYSIIL